MVVAAEVPTDAARLYRRRTLRSLKKVFQSSFSPEADSGLAPVELVSLEVADEAGRPRRDELGRCRQVDVMACREWSRNKALRRGRREDGVELTHRGPGA